MQRVWKSLEKVLKEHWPEGYESLRPGAGDAEIAALESRLGASLPAEVAESLRVHDGQHDEALWDLWALLSAEEIAAQWSLMKDLLEAGELDGLGTENGKKVAAGWWCPAWIPVCADGSGDLLCVDLQPGPKGVPGQVVWFRHDDAERSVEARSFKAWLQKVARELPKTERAPRLGPVTLGSGSARRVYRTVKPALREVLRGEWERGKEALAAFAELGDRDAVAGLGYLAAYEGDWAAVLAAAEIVVGDVETFPAANVHEDFGALSARAGAHTGDWPRVGRIAKIAARAKLGPLAERLKRCAEAGADGINAADDSAGEAERNSRSWAEYVAGGDARRPKRVQKSAESRLAHDFSVACAYKQWAAVLEMMRQHPELPSGTGSAGFEWVVEALGWARRSTSPAVSEREAWQLLIARLDRWMPVFECQVLPVELVTEEGVRELMTPARCREVLAAPKARWTWDPRASAE